VSRTGAGRKLALFVTHAAPEGMDLLDGWLDNCKAAAGCAQMGDIAKGQPDESGLRSATEFGSQIACGNEL
jgi:hypothetical protein